MVGDDFSLLHWCQGWWFPVLQSMAATRQDGQIDSPFHNTLNSPPLDK